MTTDTAVATRYVCAKDAQEALLFHFHQSDSATIEGAKVLGCAGQDDFEITISVRRMKP